MYSQIATNKRNTVLLIAGFVIFVGLIGAALGYVYEDYFLAIWVVAIASVYAFFQYFAASKLAVNMAGGRKIEKKDNPRLYNVVENLSITTGLPMPEVYIVNDSSPNAFATGRDPEHALVAATTGLLDLMDDKELTAVMAHEMSHVKNYDIRLDMVVFGLTCVIGVIADVGLRMMRYSSRRSSDNDQNPIVVIIGIVALVLAPVVAAIGRMAISREREYLADMSAVEITRYPEGMISALQKLGADKQPMKNQSSSMEAMYIKEPLSSRLFSTHPSIEKRIERLENAKNKF